MRLRIDPQASASIHECTPSPHFTSHSGTVGSEAGAEEVQPPQDVLEPAEPFDARVDSEAGPRRFLIGADPGEWRHAEIVALVHQAGNDINNSSFAQSQLHEVLELLYGTDNSDRSPRTVDAER